jgi:pyridoxine/pyridoxamine 5'-phosphate oxidase
LKRALIKLASAARAIQTSAHDKDDSYSLLQKCFGEQFERIRTDLAEQRVLLEPTSENPTPSPEHVILGFALHLGSIAAKYAAGNVNELADRLRAELEPVLAQNQLTEALFVALQLSAFPNSNVHTLSSRARSALLLAWASSQNSLVNTSRMTFWAHEDANAYLDFIEEVFVEPVSDGWSSLIIAPLLEIWRTSQPTTSPLEPRLRRWLILIWKSHDIANCSEAVVEGYALPVARSQN